jgi:hypothetical protein
MGEDDKKTEVELDHRLEPSHNEAPTVVSATLEQSSVSQPEVVLPTPVQPKKNKRKLLFVGIIAGLLVLLAGVGGAAYFVYYLPNTPENVVRQALANALTQEELKNSGKLTGDLSIKGQSGVNANVNFSISKDKASGLALNVKSYGVTADIITKDGKTIYVKVGGLNGLDQLLKQYSDNFQLGEYSGLLEALSPLTTKINNQWYEIDDSLLGSTQDLSKSLSGDIGLSQQDIDKIVDIYLDNEFIVVDKKGATVEIDGKSATEYQVHIDGQKLKSFAVELKNANIKDLELTDDDINQINEFVNKYNLSEYPFTVWIDDAKNFVQFSYSHKYSTAEVNLKLTMTDQGSDVNIETPKDSKSVFELMTDVQPLLESLELGNIDD